MTPTPHSESEPVSDERLREWIQQTETECANDMLDAEVVAVLTELLHRRAAPSAWLPISEAPRDGTVVWAHCRPRYIDGRPMNFAYQAAVWWREQKWREPNRSVWGWEHSLDGSLSEPTHWMPLPEPPK